MPRVKKPLSDDQIARLHERIAVLKDWFERNDLPYVPERVEITVGQALDLIKVLDIHSVKRFQTILRLMLQVDDTTPRLQVSGTLLIRAMKGHNVDLSKTGTAKEIERKRRIETTERMLAETNFEVTPDLAQALSDHMGISYNATHKFLRREAERGSFTRIKFATAESHITTDDITIKPVYTRKKGGCWERRKGRYANVCPGSHICKRLIVGAMTQDELNDELDKIGHSPRPVELMLCEGASLENDVNGEVIL